MTDQTEAQDQEPGEEQQAEPEQKPEQEQQAELTPQEVQARTMGWRPKEDWDDSGEATWLPAEDFVRRNERLKDRGDKILKAEITKQTREIAGLRRTLKDFGDHLSKAEQRAYSKALKEIEVKADKAVEDGDTDAYRQAKGEIKELEKEAKADAKPEPTKAEPQDDPDYDSWLGANAWYDPGEDSFDAEMASYADSIIKQIGRLGLDRKAFYDRITKETKKKYADRFGNQRRRQAPAVEDVGSGGGGNDTSLWKQVPREARATFKRFCDEGIYKDTKEGREKYADIYVNE